MIRTAYGLYSGEKIGELPRNEGVTRIHAISVIGDVFHGVKFTEPQIFLIYFSAGGIF
jgi:hypothetical protein